MKRANASRGDLTLFLHGVQEQDVPTAGPKRAAGERVDREGLRPRRHEDFCANEARGTRYFAAAQQLDLRTARRRFRQHRCSDDRRRYGDQKSETPHAPRVTKVAPERG
jgi:hypothetical protein